MHFPILFRLLAATSLLCLCTGCGKKSGDSNSQTTAKLPPEERKKVAMATAHVLSLEMGIKAFFTQYERMPVAQGIHDDVLTDTAAGENSLVAILSGKSASLNPAKALFAPEVENRDSLEDPWGHPYKVALDSDLNGRLRDPQNPDNSAQSLLKTVLLWSGGPDGDPSTWNDNVCSWK